MFTEVLRSPGFVGLSVNDASVVFVKSVSWSSPVCLMYWQLSFPFFACFTLYSIDDVRRVAF